MSALNNYQYTDIHGYTYGVLPGEDVYHLMAVDIVNEASANEYVGFDEWLALVDRMAEALRLRGWDDWAATSEPEQHDELWAEVTS